jgi:Zn ribbon nucleic-acid-binding protein
MGWDRIPARIEDIPDVICGEILACRKCGKNYKIIPQELKIVREKKLPLPAHCPDCRLEARLGTRNPRKLWQRSCAKCGEDIQTTYPPKRPEIIYCEECYLKEVY